jgi:hypothetical protein
MLDSYHAFVAEKRYLLHACNSYMVYQTCPSCFCGAIDAFSYISWIMLCSVFCACLGSLSPCMIGGVKASTGFSCGAHTHKKIPIVSHGSQQKLENFKLELERN